MRETIVVSLLLLSADSQDAAPAANVRRNRTHCKLRVKLKAIFDHYRFTGSTVEHSRWSTVQLVTQKSAIYSRINRNAYRKYEAGAGADAAWSRCGVVVLG